MEGKQYSDSKMSHQRANQKSKHLLQFSQKVSTQLQVLRIKELNSQICMFHEILCELNYVEKMPRKRPEKILQNYSGYIKMYPVECVFYFLL